MLILWDICKWRCWGASDVIQHGGSFLHFSLFPLICFWMSSWFLFFTENSTFYSKSTVFNSLACSVLQALIKFPDILNVKCQQITEIPKGELMAYICLLMYLKRSRNKMPNKWPHLLALYTSQIFNQSSLRDFSLKDSVILRYASQIF